MISTTLPIDQQELYIILEINTQRVVTGSNSSAVPKLYKLGSAKSVRNQLNSRKFANCQYKIVRVSVVMENVVE